MIDFIMNSTVPLRLRLVLNRIVLDAGRDVNVRLFQALKMATLATIRNLRTSKKTTDRKG